jgi:hypothetical protein
LGLRRFRGRWIMDWSVCLADAVTRGRKEQGGEALLGPFRFCTQIRYGDGLYELRGA